MELKTTYKVLRAAFGIFNTLMFIVGIVIYINSFKAVYIDENGLKYPEVAVEIPPFITIQDSNGETIEAPNKDNIPFVFTVNGSFVSVKRVVEFKPNIIICTAFLSVGVLYNLLVCRTLLKVRDGLAYQEAKEYKKYKSILE